jgi:uncharacterized membrane protein SirB2
MEIQIQTTKEDFAAFRLKQLLKRREMRWKRITATVVPPALLVGIALIALSQQQPGKMRTINFWCALLILPIYFGLVWIVMKRKITEQADEMVQSPLFTPGTSTITVESAGVGIIRGTDVIDFKEWKDIRRVTADDDYAFFHVNDNEAVLVPRRCFPKPEMFEIFVKNAVISHWNAENAMASAASRQAKEPRPRELKPLVIPMPEPPSA